MRRIICVLAALLLLIGIPVPAEAESERGLFEQITGAEAPPGPAQTAAADAAAAQPVSKGTHTTIMIYMCGSNLESGSGSASADIREICSSGVDTGQVNLLLCVGGSTRWRFPGIKDGNGYYQVTKDGVTRLYGERKPRNMGDPATLRGFLQFGYEQFPAEHYALILWDHGGGSLQGICFDENYRNDGLTMAELERALAESPAAKTRLDWLGFDACLMASMETARVVAPYAGYMVASEEVEPGEGWDYRFLKGIEADPDPEATGRRIADCYMESFSLKKANLTMSTVNLDKLAELFRQIELYFGGVSSVAENYAEISRARRQFLSFGRDSNTPSRDYDLVDLGDMVRSLPAAGIGDSERAQRLLDALADCTSCFSSEPKCTGLTAYFPFYNKNAFPARIRAYREMGYSRAYEAFLTRFGECLVGNSVNTPAVNSTWKGADTMTADAHKDTHSLFFMPLSEEQIARIGKAEIVALQKCEDGEAWRLVATQDAAITEDGNLYGEYVHVNLFLVDDAGKPLCDIPLVYTQREDGLYELQTGLRGRDGGETDARLICSYEPAKRFLTVEDVYLYDESTGSYSMRLSASLDDFSEAVCRVEERVMKRDGEQMLSDFGEWEVRSVSRITWKLDGEWHLAFRKDYLELKTLSVAFRITDIFNNTCLSDPVPLVQKPRGTIVLTYDDTLLLLKERNARIMGIDSDTALFSVGITNRTDQELTLSMAGLRINGEAVDRAAELYGSGEDAALRLLKGESRLLMLKLPVKGGVSEITRFSFEILVQSPQGEVLDTVTVKVDL